MVHLIPNRLQQPTDTDTSSAFFLNPEYLQCSFLRGYRTEPLAKTGLSEKRLISVDYCLMVLNEKNLGAIHAIDETTPCIA